MANGYDALICGGGLTGLGAATALAGAGFSVALADPILAGRRDGAVDGRVTALTRNTQRAFAAFGIWEALAPAAEPILQVVATDAKPGQPPSPLRLTLDSQSHDGAPFGYIAENRHIASALADAAQKAGAVFLSAHVESVEARRQAAEVRLSSGETLSVALVVAADGRNSRLRAAMNIGVVTRDYDQTAIVLAIAHDHPHHGVACDHFLPSGPFAVLPMTGQRSALVWSERPAAADRILALPDEAFDAEIQSRVGTRLGTIHAEGKRWSYPLRLMLARSFVGPRFCLVGDAAHVMHPLAGHNFNFGLQDVAALTDILRDGVKIGLDPGDASLLLRYQRRRRPVDVVGTFAMDAVDRIFSNDATPLRGLRDLGLATIDAIGPLRRLFMRVGDR